MSAPVESVILCEGFHDDSGAAPRAESALQSIKDRVVKADSNAAALPEGDPSVDGGATIVSTVLWSADDAPAPHLPAQQTLERLVCAALRAAYPKRAAAVAQWLSSRPDAASPGPKEHAWSHMAGWYGASGCDDFYQAVWRDAAVIAELEARLEKSGAERVAAALSG